MTFMRFIHKWIGVFLGIQIILWMVSGFIMSFYDHDMVEGHNFQAHIEKEETTLSVIGDISPILQKIPQSENILDVSATIFRNDSVIMVRTDQNIRMFNAVSGRFIAIDEKLARQIAIEDFSGDGEVIAVNKILTPTLETRESVGPGWRVDFDNEENSSLYISAKTGQIWERRHDMWRQFDFFWMLHIMDYQNRKNFNNWIVILSAWTALWIGISGIILLIKNIRRGDFKLKLF